MRTTLLLCVITIFAFAGPAAWAQTHDHDVDQFQESYYEPYGNGGETIMAQTFTAGLPGILCHVEIGNLADFDWRDAYQPVVQIHSGLTPWGTQESLLGEAVLPRPLPLQTWTSIDFLSQNIEMTPGQMYSIVVWASDLEGTVNVGATTNPGDYTRGDLYSWGIWPGSTEPEWGLLSAGDPTQALFDMQFRTYVVPVPLPAGVWLGICAVGVAGWHLKRRQMA